MHEWQSGVVFDWKIAVRHADKDATRDTAQFADKQGLIVPAAYMFEHRIRRSYFECGIFERKSLVRRNSDVANFRVARLELDGVSKSAGGDSLGIGIFPLDGIRVIRDDVGNADVEDFVRRLRLHGRDEIVIDSIARATEHALRERSGRDDLVVFFVNYCRHGLLLIAPREYVDAPVLFRAAARPDRETTATRRRSNRHRSRSKRIGGCNNRRPVDERRR